jgi:cobalt-zinc-cadmium efflux system membrane fusion protein
MRPTAVLLLLVAGACRSGAHDHHGPAEPELPGQSVTLWTPHHELFMEHRPLIAGQETSFAAHVTKIPGFKAATAGTVTVTVKLAGGAAVEGKAEAPSSPGIFRPALTPAAAGRCEMSVTIERDGLREVLPVEACQVYPDATAAIAALGGEEEPPGRITYLKEQAWKTEFAVVAAAERELQPSVRATAEIRPVAGKEARLTAPVTGRVTLVDPPPVLGATLAKGQLLATLLPRPADADRAGVEAEARTARAELDAAQAQLARAERLVADQAIPEKQLAEARTRVSVARARMDAATGRRAQLAAGASGATAGAAGAYQIRSPLAGTLVSVDVTGGQTVQEGELLFAVVDLAALWLEARVFEPDILAAEKARGVWFTVDGAEQPFHVDESNGRLVTVGRVIDPRSRTVPVIFELLDPDPRLRVGQFAKVWIATGPPVRALAIPESAVVDDGGKAVVYVQVEGEAFERRPVTLGLRSGSWVAVSEGVAPGEHVVTVGAYEIKLASAAGSIPAHGHAH